MCVFVGFCVWEPNRPCLGNRRTLFCDHSTRKRTHTRLQQPGVEAVKCIVREWPQAGVRFPRETFFVPLWCVCVCVCARACSPCVGRASTASRFIDRRSVPGNVDDKTHTLKYRIYFWRGKNICSIFVTLPRCFSSPCSCIF